MDIAPDLYEKVNNTFLSNYNNDSEVTRLLEKLEKGIATHEDAYRYASKVGMHLSNAFKTHLSSGALPDGKMFYNIASRVIPPGMSKNYSMIIKYVSDVQEQLNKAAGIGIKAIKPKENKDRSKGIVDRVSSEDSFDDVSWIVGDPVVTASKSVVDDFIKANVEFHGKSGLQPKLVRRTTGKCCAWCTALAGVYDYPNVPDDVYRRHENCDCVVEYLPGDGRKQNVHSRKWR